MARRKNKRRASTLPTLVLVNKLLDEIDGVIQSRHPDEELRVIKTLEKAYQHAKAAHTLLKRVRY